MRLVALTPRSLLFVVLAPALTIMATACQDLTAGRGVTEESTTASLETATTTDPRSHMPQLVGLTQGEAEAELDALGVEYEVKGWPTPNSAKHGVVQEQDVPEGTEITAETEVVIKVGREGVEVPGLVGLSYHLVRGRLEPLGLSADITYDPPFPSIAHGAEPEPVYLVTSQSPAGGSYILVGGTVKVTCEPPAI